MTEIKNTALAITGKNAAANGVTFSGLDPILGSLGVLGNLLSSDGKDTYTLNDAWFIDPIAEIKQGVTQNPEQFQLLLAQILGQIEGNALGVPVRDPVILGSWYPIKNGEKDTGLYIVSYTKDTETVLGFGALHSWQVSSDAPLLQVTAYMLIPFVRIGNGTFRLTVDEPGFPIMMGVAVDSPADSGHLVDVNGVQFDGVKVSASIDLAAVSPFEVSLEILALKLPGDLKASNRSLADLAAITGEQYLETASALFVGALTKAFPEQSARIRYFAPLFGLSSIVPESAVSLPILEWYELFSNASHPEAPFQAWFIKITSDPQLLNAWLSCLGGFIGDKAVTVSGTGSRTSPYAVPILSIEALGCLTFTAASVVVKDEGRYFYPGLGFAGNSIAVGESQAVFVVGAAMELGVFALSPSGIAASAELNFLFKFALQDRTTGQPLAKFEENSQQYLIGSLEGGLSLGLAGQLVPYFYLNQVETPSSSFQNLNLLSPSQLADAGATVLSDALKYLLGVTNDPNALSNNIAAILGVIAPGSAGSDWPSELCPPFSPVGMQRAIIDPIGAWADYYLSVLRHTEKVRDQSAFYYLIESFALLFQADSSSDRIAVTGTGTPSSPWMAAISIGDIELPAYLCVYQQPLTDDGLRLNIGVSLSPEITLSDIKVKPQLSLMVVAIDFSKDGQTTANWFPRIMTALSLSEPVVTSAVGGLAVSIGPSQLSADWSCFSGWSWSMFVEEPALIVDGQTIALGQNLNFDDQMALQDLVRSGAATFAPFLVAVLGTTLVRGETRPGLFFTGALGLVTDISKSPIFPKGLQWSGFDQLTITSFSNPFPDLRKQIASDFASQAKAQSVLSLLAWTIDPLLSDAPVINGSGSYLDPYRMPIPFGFEVPWWFTAQDQVLGLGVGRTDIFNYQTSVADSTVKFKFDLQSRLSLIEYSLAKGVLDNIHHLPAFDFLGTLSNPDATLLVQLPNNLGSVEKLVLGFNLTVSNTGNIVFNPVVTLLGATLPGLARQDITLQDYQSVRFTDNLQTSFQTVLNAALQAAIIQVKAVPGFVTTYDLLAQMGLVLARVDASSAYGINSAGWNGLLADPDTYIRRQLQTLLSDTASRTQLFNLLQQIFHITIPSFPKSLLEVLSALAICGPAEQGYPLLPLAVLELLSSPVNSLKKRFDNLFADQSTLKRLTGMLTVTIPATKYGKFTFSSNTNGVISIDVLSADAFQLGTFIDLSGGMQLDLNNKKLTLITSAYNPVLKLALQDILTLNLATGTVEVIVGSEIVWGDHSKPAAAPLTLVPFDSSLFLDQVAAIAPVYSLNMLLNAGLEEHLLKQYPLIQKLFVGFGLADASTGRNGYQMNAVLGILNNPLGWLLSDDVLGYNGQFNIAALVELLGGLPEVASSTGIKLSPKPQQGMEITGLPYDFGVRISGADGVASFSFLTENITVANNLGKLDQLELAINIGASYQPAFTGQVILSAPKLPGPFFSTVGYDKQGFLLKLSEGSFAQAGSIGVQLLPFQGWGTLAGELVSLAAATLVQQLTPKLLDALAASGAADFVGKMRSFASSMDVETLVMDILAILTPANFSKYSADQLLRLVENKAFEWVKLRFSSTEAPATAQAIKTLLSDVLPTQLSTQGGRIVFQPGVDIPVQIKAGLNSAGYLGLWADLDIPHLPVIKVNITETGLGININDGDVAFSFALSTIVPVENLNGPGLMLDYLSASGFVLRLDPLADPQHPATPSNLSRELVPVFFPAQAGDGDLNARLEVWLLDVLKNVLPRYISMLVLNQTTVHQWLDSPIVDVDKAPTPAIIFEATSLIIKASETVYLLNSYDNLIQLTPKTFLGNFIKTLMENQLTLLRFGDNNQGQIIIGPQKNKTDHYGLRVVAPDLKLSAIPALVIQLGDLNDDWITGSGGPVGEPGLGFYVPITANVDGVEVDFTSLDLQLYNVGFDFVGTKGKPLVNFERFSLSAVQPRVDFSMDCDKGQANLHFGAGIGLKDIGLSLSPNSLAAGAGKNPIAGNLLGSGSDTSKGNPPTNPTFSVEAAYSSNIYVNLKSNTGNGNEIILPIQRSFGPLYVDNLGLGWEQTTKLLDFMFSGSVELAGLKADLIGLTVGIPTTNPTDYKSYTIDLQGLNITYKGGGVSVDAGLLKSDDPIEYTGVAIVKAGTFMLGALGSYAEIKDELGNDVPSLFVFGVLDAPLGGIPAFFITGIAAGFSYNRSLEIPSIDEVQTFPLVEGVVKGTFTQGEDPKSAMAALVDKVKPEVGQYWLAAGLKFTSFKLINSTALLFVSFGRDFELNVLGLSYASLPPLVSPSLALAYFELALKVSFKPSQGVVSAQAQLTPNSFVLSTDCRVTGGFALFLWYKNIPLADGTTIPAGDFVISLGGYHPAFQKPVYYPAVPRLGMIWKMEISVGKISISGGAYFAICPTAVMAGGYLNVTFELGPLKAWLDAYANFLIEWQPFYFNVGIGVSVGVSFGTTIAGVSITIKAELGAKLQLEGPPTHGQVEVDWYVISFTIPVGSGGNATTDNNLDWSAFEQSFLPAPAPVTQSSRSRLHGKVLMAADVADDVVQQVLKWNPQDGMQNQNTDSGLWLVQPVPFSFSVSSAIPVNKIAVTGTTFSDTSSAVIGVRPMGYNQALDAPLTVVVTDQAGAPVDLVQRGITLLINKNGAPSAMWSQNALDRKQAPAADNLVIADVFFGLYLAANQYLFAGDVPAFPISNLKYNPAPIKDLPFSSVPAYPAAECYSQLMAYQQIMDSIMKDSVIITRNHIYLALRSRNMEAPADPDLSVMASSASLVLQAPPVIAKIGIYQNGGVVDSGRAITPPVVLTKAAVIPALPKSPELLGQLKRYRSPLKLSAVRGLPDYRNHAKSQWVVNTGLIKRSAAAKSLSDIPMPEFKTLHDGGIAVWRVDDNISHSIETTGLLNLIVACFNASGALLVLTSVAGGDSYLAPKGTERIAVQVFGGEAGETIGWQYDTLLSKVSTCWSAADACLIRVQNSQRISTVSGAEIGLIDARTLMEKNRINTVNNGHKQGWIQTLLPHGPNTVGVLLAGSHVAVDALSLSIEIGKIPQNLGKTRLWKQIPYSDYTLFLYQIPEVETDEYTGILMTATTDSTSILGVYGFTSTETIDVQTLWRQLSLNYQAHDLKRADNGFVKIKIQVKD